MLRIQSCHRDKELQETGMTKVRMHTSSSNWQRCFAVSNYYKHETESTHISTTNLLHYSQENKIPYKYIRHVHMIKMKNKQNRAKLPKRSDTDIIKHKLKSLCGLLLTLCSFLVIDLSDEPNVTLPKRINKMFEITFMERLAL